MNSPDCRVCGGSLCPPEEAEIVRISLEQAENVKFPCIQSRDARIVRILQMEAINCGGSNVGFPGSGRNH